MSDTLTADPAAAIKWLAILMAFAGLYLQLRRWESRITGKIDRIEIAQPLTVRAAPDTVTTAQLAPLDHRVTILEKEVRAIRLKMDADKTEILEKIEELGTSVNTKFQSIERALGRLEGTRLP